ncbi:MAG TPA: metal ABC transporter permease [Phycisphaerae bacterium]|nr:metal ABC transporter permease [Phycisphaerae bacterium]
MPHLFLAQIDTSMFYVARYLLMAGPMIGATCALLSVYVVLRRMALIAEGVSHAGFGGIAVAVLVGYFIPALDNDVAREIITGVFCLGTAMLMGYVTRRKRVSEDSAIGIFLVASVALGMLLLSVRRNLPASGRAIPVDVESLLFGSPAAISQSDAITAGITMLVVFATIGALYYQFLYTTLDEEMARINGVNTRLINTLLLAIISLVIVTSARMVGFLMITALTIIPGATANMLSRRFVGVLIASLIIGTGGTFGAVCFATVLPYDPGPLVVLTLFLIFAAVWAFRHFFKPRVVVEEDASAPSPPDHAHEHPGAFGHAHSH